MAIRFFPSLLAEINSATFTSASTNSSALSSSILKIGLENGELVLSVGPLTVVVLMAGGLAYLWWRYYWRGRLLPKYSIIRTTLKIAGIGEIEIQPNYSNIKIAYQAWIELTTRKIALPFDPENDVIADVYNSIYEAFGRLRELAKSIPAHQLRDCEHTRRLVETLMLVLNKGLRPHLTVWQSKFRRWYAAALEENNNKNLSPQEVQRKFPEYTALVADLRRLHDEVVEYSGFLRRVAEGDRA